MFGDLELDAALPLAGLGAFLGGGADQRGRRMLLFEGFPNRNGLADALAVVELELRELPAGIAIGIGRLAILRPHLIDSLTRDGNSLFGHEHSHRARIGSK